MKQYFFSSEKKSDILSGQPRPTNALAGQNAYIDICA